MNKISLKLKVTLWYSFILFIISFFIVSITVSFSSNILKQDIEKKVITSVNDLSHKIMPLRYRDVVIPEYSLYDKGVQMVLYDNNFSIIVGRLPYGIEEDFEFKDDILRIEKYKNKEYCVYDRAVYLDNQNCYWVRGVTCLSDELSSLQNIVKYYCLFILIFIILAGVGGYLIICRAFSPVNKIRKTAKEISESTDLSRRINIGDGNDEIYALANTFDEMLDKLELSFNKEKQFTSDASHELRTPISVILSECEYGEECVDTVDELKEVIGSIKYQTLKMSNLVSELLMISRMDNNKLKLNFEDTDLSELLTFVCDEQKEIQNKNITLEENIELNIHYNVDRLLITRLFINLISNAYQYSDENTKIKVSLKEKEGVISFIVEDEGIGIEEDNLSKIWDRFYQVDSSRSNSGSGLGLSMVKWISDCHNGKLFVESKKGLGSKFTFNLYK